MHIARTGAHEVHRRLGNGVIDDDLPEIPDYATVALRIIARDQHKSVGDSLEVVRFAAISKVEDRKAAEPARGR